MAARPTLIVLGATSVVALAAGAASGLGHPLVTMISLVQVLIGALGALAVGVTRRRTHGPLVFASLLVAIQGPVLTIALVDPLAVSTLAYLVLIPMGTSVFVPWSTRTHALWLAGFGVAVAELATLLERGSGILRAPDVVGPLVVAGVVSLAGNVVGRSRRRRSFDLLEEARLLRRIVARENRTIRTSSDQAARDARTDGLTGIPNRMALDEDLAAGVGRGGAILMVDLDHFKALNDLLGHQAGDDALRQVGRYLASARRASDGVYRYGGEEFLMRLEGIDAAAALLVAERIRMGIRELAICNPGNAPSGVMTASLGLALVENGRAVEAIARADSAMYSSKQSGRDRVTVIPETT